MWTLLFVRLWESLDAGSNVFLDTRGVFARDGGEILAQMVAFPPISTGVIREISSLIVSLDSDPVDAENFLEQV